MDKLRKDILDIQSRIDNPPQFENMDDITAQIVGISLLFCSGVVLFSLVPYSEHFTSQRERNSETPGGDTS